MAPYFSIILPIYNVSIYLERCILSVLKQSFRDYELILVDDGSTDASPIICDMFAEKYDFVRVLHKPNGGLSSARNAGFEVARGEYIWWVDSDDYIEPGALKLLYDSSKEKKPDIVKFNYFRVEKDIVPVYSTAPIGFYEACHVKKILLEKAFFCASKYVLSACTHIYSRTFLEKNEIFFVSERIVGSEDYLFNLETIYAADSVCVLSETLYNYELRSESLSQQYKNDLFERYTNLCSCLYEWYCRAGAGKEYKRKINSFYLWSLIHGIIFNNEYKLWQGHTLEDGRKNIRKILKNEALQEAFSDYETNGFDIRQRIQLFAMRLQFEQLFYWLYVKKPTAK